jgi:hypothetical protein
VKSEVFVLFSEAFKSMFEELMPLMVWCNPLLFMCVGQPAYIEQDGVSVEPHSDTRPVSGIKRIDELKAAGGCFRVTVKLRVGIDMQRAVGPLLKQTQGSTFWLLSAFSHLR